MQDLVDCTGINRGSLYATYGSKHDLFVAALRMHDRQIRRKLLAEFETCYPPREAIRQVSQAFTKDVAEDGGNRGCFLTNTALELAAHDPEVGGIVVHAQEEIEAFLARMIAKGKREGQFSVRVEPSEAARGLLASLIGLVVLTRSRPDQALFQSIIREALRRLD
jgi:TetR/AcrR family transcriptional repressor of nem operon